jgi:hypothetical protein
MLFRRGEHAQGRSADGIASGLRIDLSPEPANIFWLMIRHGEHAAEEEQITVRGFDVTAKWRGRIRNLNAEFKQPTFGAARR